MKKQLPVVPTAILGIVLLIFTAIAVNALVNRSSVGSARLDLTENKIYTLSDGTKKILEDLDTPVTVRFYFTEGSRALPRGIKLFAHRVRDFLRQYERYGNGKVKFEYIDTQPDTDEEDSARVDQIRATDISATERIYLGISISCLDRKQAIPQLNPAQETLLEYNVSRAITQVVRPERPKLGIMSPLPLQGNGMPPQMGGQPGWVILQQLEMDYDVVPVPMESKEIPKDLDAVILVHPSATSPESEFALDQYLLAGGKLAVFLDAHYYFNQPPRQSNPMMRPPPAAPPSSTLPTLLKTWGLNFESGLVVADQTYRSSQQGRVLTGVSSFTDEALDKKDPVTSQLQDIFMVLPGGFRGEAAGTLHKDVLVRSSSKIQLLDGARAGRFDQTLLTEVPTTNQSYDMVVRLTGRFPTAFPMGSPTAQDAATDTADDEKTDEKDTPESLKQATGEGAVVLFADVDMIADGGAFQSNPMVPQVVQPFNGNFSLVLNTLEQLTGDTNLIGARSRPSSRRPFTVLEQLKADAEQSARDKINELQAAQKDLAKQLSTLQADQITEDGKIRLSPEQEQALRDLGKKDALIRRELRQLRKDLQKDQDRLEAGYIAANIFVIPAVVLIFGLVIAIYRRTRTAAR